MLAIVVSDTYFLKAILKRTLQENGFEVATAASGGGLLAMLAGSRCDVALIDRELPGMDGFTLLQTIRSDPGYQLTRLILLTAESNQAEIPLALASGADECLTMPFTPDALYETLRMAGLPVSDPAGIEYAWAS